MINAEDEDAMAFQKKLRDAIADFCLARLAREQDPYMTFSGVMTEATDAILEAMRAHGMEPTQQQFRKMFSECAGVIYRGEHKVEAN